MTKLPKGVIQLLAGLGLVASTWRHIVDYRLPSVFMVLPLSMLCLPLMFKIIPGISDSFSRNAILGVITGVNCGFLTTISNIQRTTVINMTSIDEGSIIQIFEILHIPVFIITIVDSFFRIFSRFPSPRSLQTAAIASLVADLIFIIILLMVDPSRNNVVEIMGIFLVVYFHLLLLMIMPLFKENSRAWMLLIGCISLSIQWQIMGLGSAMWSLQRFSFPVPGAYIGLIYIYHCRGGWPQEELKKGRPVLPVEMVRGSENNLQDYQLTSLHWLVMSFALERMALHGVYSKHIDSDTISACMLLSAQVFVLSPLFQGTKTVRVIAVIAASLSYLCHTLVSRQLINAYILEITLALTLVDITNVADKSSIDSAKIAIL